MSKINVSTITNRTGTSGPVLSGVTTATNGLNITAGNVGIGTDNPSGKLNLVGNDSQLLNIIQDSGDLQIRMNDRGTGSAYIKVPDNTGASLTVETGGSERLRITSAGLVGIGTDNPLTKIHIQSTITSGDLEVDRIDNSQNGPEVILRHISSSPANNDYVGQITFSGRDDANNNTTVARIDGVMSNVVNGSESGEIVFNTRHNGTFSEKARFNSTGNLAFASGNGIDFSATEGSGASSSLLDDYEEGTHTTVFSTNGTGTITVSSGNDQLSYIKIGNLVNVIGRPTVDSVSSPTGYIRMTLPFTTADVADAGCRSAAALNIRLVNVGYDVGLFTAQVSENSNLLSFNYGGSNDSTVSGPAMKAGTQIWINITYRTA